jgi:hypothetical protein
MADLALHRSHAVRCRRGITLLELILALALMAMVMFVISMAIDLHLRTLDQRRTQVEEAELARAVLNYIASDIRSAVLYDPIDLTAAAALAAGGDVSNLLGGLGSLTGAASAGTGAGGSQSSGSNSNSRSSFSGGNSGASGRSGSATSRTGSSAGSLDPAALSESMSASTSNIADSAEPTSVPGLFGNQFSLQVDVSRLPRVDQYSVVATSGQIGAPVDIPSDVKTVAYFLGTANTSAAVAGGTVRSAAGGNPSGQSGLIRRELDRAVTSYASSNGGLDPSAAGGELLAPEVNYLEFRYFDGMQWYTAWDSEQMGGLPVAIEVTLGLDPSGGKAIEHMGTGEQLDLLQADPEAYRYRLVVHLPAARAMTVESTEAEIDSAGLQAVGL